MTTIDLSAATVERPGDRFERDEAELAAASFLARNSGRTLEAYRHDLRGFFQWAADNHLEVLKATRPHIELFRAWMEDRQLAASTIDRRLSRCAASTASPTSTAGSDRTQPSTSAARRSTQPTHEDSTAPSSACSCSPPSTTTTNTPPSPFCSASAAYA